MLRTRYKPVKVLQTCPKELWPLYQECCQPSLRAFCEAGLMNEVVVDGSKSYFDTRTDDHPHFYWEDSHRLTDAPAEELTIASLPQVPEGMAVARVDVVIRLRKV